MKIGLVIGKGGHNVKAIQALSGARVNADNADDDVYAERRLSNDIPSPLPSDPLDGPDRLATAAGASKGIEVTGSIQQVGRGEG